MRGSIYSALKISGLLSLGGVMIAGLLGAVIVFVISLILLTFVFYIYRIIFPQKPLKDEYEIREMCEKYMEFAINAIGEKLPAKVDNSTQWTRISYENRTLTFRYSFEDGNNMPIPTKEVIRKDMIKQLGKKEAYGMLHVACVYLEANWSIRYRSQTTFDIYESSLTCEEMKTIISKWHEFGTESKWDV